MKSRTCGVFVISILSGIFLSVMFVNPYTNKLSITNLVLQLSGSRGELPLGVSLPELVSFSMRLIPEWIFECYFGVSLYKHFCVASIYVFSRQPNRTRWYLREFLKIGLFTIAFQLLLLLSVVFTTMLRYQLHIDETGVLYIFVHLFVRTLWTFSMTALINLVAIFKGSGGSFGGIVGMQGVLIVLLKIVKIAPNIIKWNPIAWLVLGWQNCGFQFLASSFDPVYSGFLLEDSIMRVSILCVSLVAIGAIVINKHSLLVLNTEID